MRLLLRILAWAALSAAATPARAERAQDAPEFLYAGAVNLAYSAFQQGEYKRAYNALQPLVVGPDYIRLSPKAEQTVDRLYGQAARRMGEYATAKPLLIRATFFQDASADDWFERMYVAQKLNDGQDAYAAFKVLRTRFPEFYKELHESVVTELDRQFRSVDATGDAAYEFESYLFKDVEWRPVSPFFTRDVLRLHYAIGLYERGEVEQAERAANEITSADVLVALRSDRRFAGLTDKSPERFDPTRAALALIERAGRVAQTNSFWLLARNEGAATLMLLGRNEDSLKSVEETLATAPALSISQKQESYDFTAQLARARLIKGSLLIRLGRQEEGYGILSGVYERCDCHDPLYLGEAATAVGRAKEALSLVGAVRADRLPPRMQAFAAEVAGCAAAEVKDASALQAAISRATSLRRAKPEALVRILLCAERMDEASAAIRIALADPYQRPIALAELARTSTEAKTEPAFLSRLALARARLRNRPDVRAAVVGLGG